MTKIYPYLQKRKQRKRLKDAKDRLVFGLVLGWLLTLIGGFHAFFVADAMEWLWHIVFILGLCTLAITVIVPRYIDYPEALLRNVTKPIGHVVFSVVLTLTYFLVVLPIGAGMQVIQGRRTFYSWQDTLEQRISSWEKYTMPKFMNPADAQREKRPLLLQPLWILAYFIKNGNYVLIPILILLLGLGLVMFFVQTSSLAPFIYTLF